MRSKFRSLAKCTGAAAILLLLSSAALAQTATVTTDKEDYAPGEIVIITGTGWQPGETVQMVLHETPFTHPDRYLSAVADASGNFTNSEFSPEEHDLGITFTLTATGQSSGFIAQTAFRDANRFWRGCTNSDWHTATNWSSTGGTSCPSTASVPGAADVATIQNVTGLGRPNPIISSAASVISINVDSGATLNVQANLTLSDSQTIPAGGTWSQSAGATTFSTSGKKVTVFGGFNVSGGTFGALGGDAPDFLIESTGSASQSGGTINLNIFEVKVGRTFTQSGAGSLLALQKDWKNEGTFTSSGGRVRLAPGSVWASPNTATNQFFDIEWDAAVTVNGQTIGVGGDWFNDALSGSSLTSNDTLVRFNGDGNRTIGGGVNTTFRRVEISKTGGGSVTLARDTTVGAGSGTNLMNILSGTFDHGASFNLIATDGISISAGATYRSVGTGDLMLGADLSNAGTVQMNGVTTACGEADLVAIASTSSTTSRTWSGAGTFDLQDVDIRRQTKSGSAITVYSGTDSGNNSNFLFAACPVVAVCGNGIVEGAEACDAGAGNGTANSCCTASCTFQPALTACGDQDATACNAPNSCDAAGVCVDRKDAAGSICLEGSGACDPDDVCDGASNACAPVFAAAGAACGDPSDTECTNPDSCDGSGACQANNAADGSTCGDAGAECTNQDTCSAGACIDNGFKAATTACGDQSDTACDNPNTCSGNSAACLDNFEPVTAACGDAEGACTNADSCDGSGSCQDNGFKAEFTACGDSDGTACNAADSCDAAGTCVDRKDAANTVCLAGAGACDPDDVCDGTTNTCAPVYAAEFTACGDSDGTACNAADSCDAAGSCIDRKDAAGSVCLEGSGACDPDDVCDGTTNTCAPVYAAEFTACGDSDGTACNAADSCDAAGSCVDRKDPAGTVCLAAGADATCDPVDTCDGTTNTCEPVYAAFGVSCGDSSDTECTNPDSCDGSGACQANNSAEGSSCGDAGSECVNRDTCSAGVCIDNGFKPATTACGSQADTACDNPNTCSGDSAACLNNFEPTTTACGDAEGACTNADSCDGTGSCQDNGFKAEFTACGDSDGTACNAADSCDATGTCVDRKDPGGSVCLAGSGACDPDDVCDGTSNTCAPVYAAAGSACGDADGECTNADSCNATGTCVDNGFKPSTTTCGDAGDGICDTQDTCSGSDGSCVDRVAAAGTACGDGSDTDCTNPDTCDSSGSCQVNHAASGTLCDDGEACSTNDMCDAGGECAGTIDPVCAGCTGNAPPVFTTVTATPSDPQPYSNGNANVTANFTDAPGTHSCTIDWGDGSAVDTFPAQDEPTVSDPIGSCTGSHLYTAVGVYEVTITVSDGCTSGSATTVYQYFVLYDPNGGFVTGGGWINSPAGAYPTNPDLTGKANFGFVSKYQKNATTPTGNTQFHFNAAGFKFDSDSYEWLVISGAKARYRGVGQVNGQGSYGFELTAWDAQAPGGGGGVDRFRIKIWDHNQGNGVVYDNMMGADDGVDPTTTLGGGSIVIHKK